MLCLYVILLISMWKMHFRTNIPLVSGGSVVHGQVLYLSDPRFKTHVFDVIPDYYIMQERCEDFS